MGLASKLAAGGSTGGQSQSQPAPQGGGYGQSQAMPGAQQGGQFGQQPGQMGQQSAQMGQQPGQMGQQPGQMGQQSGPYGQQPRPMAQQSAQMGQQPGQMGQQPGQMGQQSGQYGQQTGQMGQQSSQMGQQLNQFGQQPGQMGQQTGQYGQQSGQMGQQPQGQYGQQGQGQTGMGSNQAGPSPGTLTGGATNSMGGILHQKLQKMVQINRLEAFYPPQNLQNVFNKIDRVDFRGLATKWNMPVELATDLATLALYDIIIFADDSGSMVFEENGERINDLKVILGRVAEVATMFDDDGILIRFMNCNVEGNGIRDAASASNLVSQVQFNGLTPLGTSLNAKVIQPFLASAVQSRSLQKPILVIIITDGEPTGEPSGHLANVMKQAKNLVSQSQYGAGAVAFEIAQVGKDQKAQNFLATLDKDPEIGGMVDATSYYELEAEECSRKGVTLTPELWLVKLCCGAVDPSYDEQD